MAPELGGQPRHEEREYPRGLKELASGAKRRRKPAASLGVALTIGATDVAGARIERVQPGSAAAQAGLEAGDVVVEFGGKTIKEWSELIREIRRRSPGDEVELKVLKGGAGDAQSVKVVLKERPRGSGTR